MGAAGRSAVFERYNWEAAERQLLAFYERVLAQPPGPPSA
jgi:hypothetical protein